MVTIPRLCSLAKISRSGILAIVPSSFMISQITPADFSPARRARSTEPSVCPVLTRTPPLRARMGKTCPGLTMSSAVVSAATAVRIVVARSAVEIPVVTPFLASMEIVKAVPKRERFSLSLTIKGSSS